MLPDFLIIGAMKCGTTSLYNYLRDHPEIAMSQLKEPSYFCHSYDRPLSWYQSLFPKKEDAVLGEASTHYTKYPIHNGIPARIHDVLPSVKLIYLVRDPVERIVSQYVHERTRDEETRPMSDCLTLEKTNPYIAYSCYAEQIKQYRPYFEDEQILVVNAHKLKNERQQTLHRIIDFLGVEALPLKEERVQEESNQSAGSTERTGIVRTLAQVSWLHRAYACVPERVRDVLKPLYRSPVQKPEIETSKKEALYEYFRPEVEWLRQYTGKTFDTWNV
jgi:hypothetical protein